MDLNVYFFAFLIIPRCIISECIPSAPLPQRRGLAPDRRWLLQFLYPQHLKQHLRPSEFRFGAKILMGGICLSEYVAPGVP